MKKRFKILLHTALLCLLLTACEQTASEIRPHIIYNCEDNLCIESLMSDSSQISDVNADNLVYTAGHKYLFNYYYVSARQDTFLLDDEGYTLTPWTDTTNMTLVQVGFSINNSGSHFMGEDYKQSVINYHYIRHDKEQVWPKESSGLIENEKNIWIHPYRLPKYFKMLNLNPYPMVKYPVYVDQTWTWSLGVGTLFADPAWKTWTGVAKRRHNYRVLEQQIISTENFGDRSIYVIEAVTAGDIGPSQLTTYFNEEIGFLKLHYFNIDGSQYVFELAAIEDL